MQIDELISEENRRLVVHRHARHLLKTQPMHIPEKGGGYPAATLQLALLLLQSYHLMGSAQQYCLQHLAVS